MMMKYTVSDQSLLLDIMSMKFLMDRDLYNAWILYRY